MTAPDSSRSSQGVPENATESATGPQNREQAAGSQASRSALLGAVFLMATSAIGPGFITQT
ncbi:MAG TPA: hypothetical protein VLA97_08185, partial [Nocardioidaceae bacterium]|nr:hypothetical protein [Nocardioidaceae bacterium]